MAEHGKTEITTATGNDYAEHEWTYNFFVALTKWSTISIIVVLILMATFLV